MAKNERFEVIFQEGNGLTSGMRQVLMDTATGVQYLFVKDAEWLRGRTVPAGGQGGRPPEVGCVKRKAFFL